MDDSTTPIIAANDRADARDSVPSDETAFAEGLVGDDRDSESNTRSIGALKAPVGMAAGAAFGLASAVLYTASNIALRKSVGVDPFLVSAVKAAPTVLAMGPFLIWMSMTGQTIATSYRMVPRFLIVSLIGQFIGNAAFQVALGVIVWPLPCPLLWAR